MTTTKKTAAKKVVAKKSTKNAAPKAKKLKLVCAEGEQCFWTNNGVIVSNLIGLRDLLATIADDVYRHHVSTKKNDFADWVQHVLADAELADALRRSKQPNTAHTVVVRRLKLYEI